MVCISSSGPAQEGHCLAVDSIASTLIQIRPIDGSSPEETDAQPLVACNVTMEGSEVDTPELSICARKAELAVRAWSPSGACTVSARKYDVLTAQ
jgi:hypothetical protein